MDPIFHTRHIKKNGMGHAKSSSKACISYWVCKTQELKRSYLLYNRNLKTWEECSFDHCVWRWYNINILGCLLNTCLQSILYTSKNTSVHFFLWHNIAKLLLKLSLNTKLWINQSFLYMHYIVLSVLNWE